MRDYAAAAGSRAPHHGQNAMAMDDVPPSWTRMPYPGCSFENEMMLSGQSEAFECCSHR